MQAPKTIDFINRAVLWLVMYACLLIYLLNSAKDIPSIFYAV